MKGKLLAALVAVACTAAPAFAQEKIKFKAIGQPLATGLIQKNKEQPFFENFGAEDRAADRCRLQADRHAGHQGHRAAARDEGRPVRHRVAARVAELARRAHASSASTWWAPARTTPPAARWPRPTSSTVDARLQQQFNVKLLGVWPFGPQILFCKKPIAKLADIKGLKVRVYDQNLAKFIEMVGATPVPVSFAETHQCAVARCRRLRDHRPELRQLRGMAGGVDAPAADRLSDGAERLCGIARRRGTSSSPTNRPSCRRRSTRRPTKSGSTPKSCSSDAVNCNVGKDPCTTGKKFNLVNVPVTPADIELVVRSAVREVSLPVWAEACDKTNPGCSEGGSQASGPIIGLK